MNKHTTNTMPEMNPALGPVPQSVQNAVPALGLAGGGDEVRELSGVVNRVGQQMTFPALSLFWSWMPEAAAISPGLQGKKIWCLGPP